MRWPFLSLPPELLIGRYACPALALRDICVSALVRAGNCLKELPKGLGRESLALL